MSGTMIVILNLDNISLSTFRAVFKQNNQSLEDMVRIIGICRGFPLKTLDSSRDERKGHFFLIVAKMHQ